MQELLLGLLLAGDELDIVYQQGVGVTVFLVKKLRRVCGDGVQELVGEGFRGNVDYVDTGVFLLHLVLNRGQKMCLSKTGIAVNKQRIVFFVLLLGNCLGSRESEVVGRSDDEVVKGICNLVVVDDIVDLARDLLIVLGGVHTALVGGSVALHDKLNGDGIADDILKLLLKAGAVDVVERVKLEINVSREYHNVSVHLNRLQRIQPDLPCGGRCIVFPDIIFNNEIIDVGERGN